MTEDHLKHHEGPGRAVVGVLPIDGFRSNFGVSTGVSSGTQRHINDLEGRAGTGNIFVFVFR